MRLINYVRAYLSFRRLKRMAGPCYKLEGRRLVRCSVFELVRSMQAGENVIAKSEVGKDIILTTVMSMPSVGVMDNTLKILPFESWLRGGGFNLSNLYSTYEEAIAGHQMILDYLGTPCAYCYHYVNAPYGNGKVFHCGMHPNGPEDGPPEYPNIMCRDVEPRELIG